MAAKAYVRPGSASARLARLALMAASTFSDVAGSDGDAHADRVMDGVEDRGRGRHRRRLADALGAERSGRIEALHDVDGDLRHVERRRHDVIGQVGIDVAPLGVEQHLLLQRHADAHRNAALDLAFDQHRIDGGAAIMRGGDAQDFDLAGLVVDVDLGDLRGVDVGRERLALPGLRIHGDGRRVPRGAADRRLAENDLRAMRHLPDRNIALRIALHLDFSVFRLELADLHPQHGRRGFEQNRLGGFGGEPDGVAGDISRAAGDGAGIHRRRVGIGGDDMHVVGGDAERLGRDLAEHRERALPGLDRAGEHRRGAVLVHLYRRRARIGIDGKADRIPHAGDAASAPFHERGSQPKRSAALRSVSLTTTLCSTWPVGLDEPSSKALSRRISSGSMPSFLAMSSICNS